VDEFSALEKDKACAKAGPELTTVAIASVIRVGFMGQAFQP
jgi:hypothetical protein